jgi:hypothetical protein
MIIIKNILNIVFFFITLLICNTSEEEQVIYKCGKNNLKQKPQKIKNSLIINHSNNTLHKRKLDNEGFKDFNIYMDLTNIKQGIKTYNLKRYENLFLSAFNKVIDTIKKLLKVKPLKYAYYVDTESIKKMNVNYWDTSKFGDYAKSRGISTDTLDIDLVIFGRFDSRYNLGDNVLANALAYYFEEETGQPVVGLVNINKDLDYSAKHSQEYFESILLHEITHILGFDIYFFYYYYNNLLIKEDLNGTEHYYINSTKVVDVAKKYFNCDNVIGVELENDGGSGTAGSHWEARVLLGEYMNGVIYSEEQVISEFTLALLEDTGLYKANYYTGGLMRYGKNKGCDFLYEKCIENGEIIKNAENEFFEWNSLNAPSCSSGRQSRTYNLLLIYKNEIPEKYQYYNETNIGGLSSADYCPVHKKDAREESRYGYYVGHCSNKGSGEYGSTIYYYNKSDENSTTIFHYKSKELEKILGEKYSDSSFCYLSSLVKNSIVDNDLYSNTFRALCFETFCSSKSLTLRINDDYIVCPREGGKIKVKGYNGYLLCPDYNLICSGTVLCNDMFDCVNKKSELKQDTYNYDYQIKTSQNIEIDIDAQNSDQDFDILLNYYELSQDGECPQYCRICDKNKNCLECRKDYIFIGNPRKNDEIIKCASLSDINKGYYRVNESYYFECIENCDICNDGTSCESCNSNSLKLFNKCILKINNCKDYNEDGSCKLCDDNFAFIEDNNYECINKELISDEYYTKDDGVNYYTCNGLGINHMKNCIRCHYNDTLVCDECVENKYNLLFKCVNEIRNCSEYDENGNCRICEDDFAFIEENRIVCINKRSLIKEQFYTKDNGISYYTCNGEGNNHIQNCKKCHYNNKLECDEFFENGNINNTGSFICFNFYVIISILFILFF